MHGTAVEIPIEKQERTVFTILAAISFCHLMNDMVQSLIPSLYPMLKNSFRLSFAQLGLITLSYQMTASLLQPVVGFYTDRTPRPYSLPIGMGLTLVGLLFLSVAPNFSMLLFAASLVGVGSAIFHPESSRLARLSSGGKHGFAQSVFQVGGNSGSAIGPLMAALIVLPRGQHAIAWFSVAALAAIIILLNVGNWYKAHLTAKQKTSSVTSGSVGRLSSRKIAVSIAVLIALIFSKFFYLASLTSYYTFYLISKFHVSVRSSQIHLFVFLAAVAAGTIIGGPIGDRFGRKLVIWCSILGVLPFTLLLPYANLLWTGILSVVIGLILASAFSAILVYAQELVPGRIGMVSGLFFGFAFGMGGVGAALLGKLADMTNIGFVYHICSYLPAIGLLTGFLPNIQNIKRQSRKATA
ncbi:MAG TPA: MFS transporter [Terriglobales bacterium]|nr:MFS transporter [Terriglobales bacterium]